MAGLFYLSNQTHLQSPEALSFFADINIAEMIPCYNLDIMMPNRKRDATTLFRKILPQIIILVLISVLYLLSFLEIIPSPAGLNSLLVESFKTYGLPLIAVCAFLENLVGVNTYFPGAFTILTGMALTAGNPAQAVLTYLVIYLPSYAANVLSYYFGFLYANDAEKGSPQKRKTLLWFFFTYWHPQLAGLTAFSAGANKVLLQRDFIKHSLGVSLFWSILWALIIYRFGIFADVARNFSLLFLCYVVIWTVVDICKWSSRQSVRVN